MERADHELLMSKMFSDHELKKLYDRHRKLEKEVENLNRYAAYSSSAALKQTELKKLKLHNREMIMAKLSDYKVSPAMRRYSV